MDKPASQLSTTYEAIGRNHRRSNSETISPKWNPNVKYAFPEHKHWGATLWALFFSGYWESHPHPDHPCPTVALRQAAMVDTVVVEVPGQTTPSANVSGTSWAAILGGAFVIVAIGLLLLAIGAGFGLSTVSPWPGV